MNQSFAPHIYIIDDEVAGESVAVLCHGSWRQAAFGQSHHFAETFAIAAAEVGIDEMVDIFQAQGSRGQHLIDYRQHVEKVNRSHLLLHAESVDHDVGVAI